MLNRRIEIGKLNKKIIIGNLDSFTNENGFPEQIFREKCTLWADVKNLYGRQFYEASAVQLEDTVTFLVRYNKSINYKCLIEFRDNFYEIIHIDNIQFENRFLEIKTKILDKDRLNI